MASVATVSFPVYLYPVQVTSHYVTFSLGNHTCFDFRFASLQFCTLVVIINPSSPLTCKGAR